MLGVLFCLLAVVSFGLNMAIVRRGVITGSVIQAVVVTMPIGLVAFAVLAAAFGQLGEIERFSLSEIALLAGVGVIHFVFGRYCAYRTIQAIGVNLWAPLEQWSLLIALALAITVLHESLDLMKLLGIGLLMLGPAMVVRTQNARLRTIGQASQAAPGKFEPKLLEGYTFGVLTCVAFGLTPIMLRAGLEGTGMAFAGGVVSYGAATVVIALILLLPAARRDVARIERRNVSLFVWTGVTTSIAQIFVYLAFSVAPVTVVQPLLRFYTVFSTLFNWMFNRGHEIYEAGVLTAIGISLLGALLLTIDAGTVMRWLDAPPWLAAAFAWKWPDR